MPTDGTGNPKIKRRLAAILAADIAGYSALMGVGEARTVSDLKAHQALKADTWAPTLCARYRSRRHNFDG
jgi:hypothetical protein